MKVEFGSDACVRMRNVAERDIIQGGNIAVSGRCDPDANSRCRRMNIYRDDALEGYVNSKIIM